MPTTSTARTFWVPALLLTVTLAGLAPPAAEAAEAKRNQPTAGAWLLSLAPAWLRAWLPAGLGLDLSPSTDPSGNRLDLDAGPGIDPNGQPSALAAGPCIDADRHRGSAANCTYSS